jgi:hypothetical protein
MRYGRAPGSAALLAVFALSACSGGSVLPAGPASASGGGAQAAPSAHHRAKAQFVILVPRKRKHRRAPAYISPATKSLSLVVTSARTGASILDTTINLTALSPNCKTVPAGTECSFGYSLTNGSYVATVKTYDGLNGGGMLLSAAQKVDFSIAATTTEVDFTLDGIPHALSVASGSYAILGSQSNGFTLYGAPAAALDVSAVDADGYHIVGVGAPTYTASIKSGTGWSTSPSGAGVFAIAPPVVNGAQATIQFDATFTDATVCAQTGAVCTTTATIGNHLQRLFVANGDNSVAQLGNVTVYDPPYTGTPLTITSGTSQPQVLLLDASQNLFVGQCDASCTHSTPDRVEEYAPPYSSAPVTTITSGVSEMLGMTMDASKNLFVSYYNTGEIGVYAPPYTGAPTLVTGLVHPSVLLAAPGGNVFSVVSSSAVGEYAPPFTGAPVTISNGVNNPSGFAMDASGNLFVSNGLVDDVTVFAPPYTGAPAQTIPLPNGPGAIALDASANLYVVTPFGDAVYIYAPPYTGAPTTVSTNIYFPLAVAIDAVGNLFVANSSNGSVAIFAPPYTGTPVMVKNGVKVAQSLALTP